jgi:hypothetical protein
MCRRFQAKRTGTNVQGFLNACTCVVKEREQGVVTLAFERGTIRLGQDCSDFVLFQVTEFTLTGTFRRNAEHFRTLTCSQRLPIYQEPIKAAQSCEPAVSGSDRYLALFFAVF